MLLRFGVSNRLSMRDRQELSLTASSLKDPIEGLIDCPSSPSGSVLPAALIYGANASGKTNFIDSLRVMREMVLNSHNKGEPGGGVPLRQPFALDPENAGSPTRFDIDFVMDGVRYHYGFEASDEAFLSEWLYAFPKAHRRMLFEREGDEFHFGRSLGGQNKTIATLVRPNSLFVSAAAQNDHEQLSGVYAYFRSIRGVDGTGVPGDEASSYFVQEEPDDRVIDFLAKIGTGIIEYRREEYEVPEEYRAFRREIEAPARRMLNRSVSSNIDIVDKRTAIEFGHRGHDGDPVFLSVDRESAGTRRLLVVLDLVFRALDEGVTLCVDELDASLHTHAAEAVLALFCSKDTNPRGAQLIATTHDTNLMRSRVLRRDQVWLAEKDAGGATRLYPLTDIRTRSGDDFSKGYLQGRYGAVPFDRPTIARGSHSQA